MSFNALVALMESALFLLIGCEALIKRPPGLTGFERAVLNYSAIKKLPFAIWL